MDHTLRTNRLLKERGAAPAVGLAAVVALQLLSGCLGASGSTGGRDQIEPIDSPNQDRTLLIEVNTSQDDPTRYLTLVFEIHDKATQAVLHRQQTNASSRLAWSMRWLDNTRVQLSSSDVGTYCWQEQPGGAWVESHCP